MKFRLQDLIGIDHFQNLQDRLNKIYSFPSSIIDNEGNILTATAWQDICQKFHRKNKECERECIKSDQYILDHLHEASPAVSYRCPHGLVDNASPIIIDGVHYGNFFTGQFFLEEPDLSFFRTQAKKYGFPEEAYLEAVKKVPIWTREQLNNYLFFIKGLISVIIESALKTLKEKESLKQIQKREHRYRSILKAAMDGYWRTDVNGRILEVNEAYCKMSGYCEDELLTMSIADFEYFETPKLVTEHMQKVVSTSYDRFESKHRRKDGTTFDVEVSIQYRPEEDGQCVCFLRDITDRKQAQEAVRKQRDHAQRILNTVQAIIVALNREGRVTLINPKGCRLLGYSEDEILGRHWFSEFLPQPDGMEDVYPFFLRLVADEIEAAEYFENPIVTRKGEFRQIAWHNALMYDENGTLIGVLSAGEDITERKRAEKKQKKLEAQLSDAMNIADLGHWDYNVENDLFKFNDQFYRLFRTTAEQAGGYLMSSAEYAKRFVHPEDRDLVGEEIRKSVETSDPNFNSRLEHRIIYTDGEVGYISVRYFIVKDDHGKTVKTYGVNQDITERKRAFDEIKKANERMQLAADAAHFGIWDFDIKENRLEWDDWMFRLYGMSRDDFSGAYEAWQAGVHPDDLERSSKEVEQALRGEKEFDTEFRIVRPDGTIRHLIAHAVVSRDLDGTPLHMTGVNYDITQRVEAEAALRESENRFRTIFDHAAVGVVQVDSRSGRFVKFNQKFRDITGFSDEELSALRFQDITHPEDVASDTANLTRLVAGDIRTYALEKRYIRKDHSVVWVRVTVSPTWAAGEEPGSHITIVEDITERKSVEEVRDRLQAQLVQAQKMESVGRLAGGVAHDFNNMLGVILGSAEMALDETSPADPQYADLKEIHKAAKRSSDLTRQLLAFARKQTISPKVLDLNGTVEGMLKMLRRLIGEDIVLSWLPGSRLWRIKMDPSQVDQILANLCVNARDAVSGTGRVVIETKNIALEEAQCPERNGFLPGEYVLLSVSDNGCGMDRQTLAHLFEPFFTTKGIGQGTGLGLATIYGIVKQNGGYIDVESEPGRGTTFSIYFPRNISQADTPADVKTGSPAERGHETILLVEDEAAMLNMAKTMLERLGYRVLPCRTAVEAERLAMEHAGEIDLLITDVIMPDMNGKELAERLTSRYPNMSSLFTSGYTADVIGHHGVLKEGVHFIPKPFSRKDLACKIRDALSTLPSSSRRQND